MGYHRILAVICLLLFVCTPASALDLGKGMHGMQWSQSVSALDHLTKVRESGPVAYYVHSNTLYQVADQAVPAVVYGFYQDRFFATYIKLGSALQFNNMKRHFSGKYGTPKVGHNTEGELTEFRWKTDDLNIKLKMKASGRDIKMAIYYVPLASELNRAQLDDIPPDLYRETAPDGEPSVKPAPLLD